MTLCRSELQHALLERCRVAGGARNLWEDDVEEAALLFVELSEQLLDIVLVRFERLELVSHIVTRLHVGRGCFSGLRLVASLIHALLIL